MTKITVEYTLADQCIHPATLTQRVLMPTALGCATLLVLRYALSWEQPDCYSEPTSLKYTVASLLILAAAAIIYRSVLAMRISAKAHFLATYLKPDSAVHRLLSGHVWNTAVSIILSFFFASLAYCVIQTYSWIDIVVISLAAAAGLVATQLLGYVATDSLKNHVSTLFLSRARRAITVFCVLVAAILLNLVHDTFSPLRRCEESEVVPIIRRDIRHPVLTVQRVNRAMGYFNAQLIRAREHVSFPFGWMVYLFLLVPNTLFLYPLVCIVLGYDLCSDSPTRARGSPGGPHLGPMAALLARSSCIAFLAAFGVGCGISDDIKQAKEHARRVENQVRNSVRDAQDRAEAAVRETEARLREAEARLQEAQQKLEVAESRARDVGKDINDLMKDDRARRLGEDSPAKPQ